MVLRRHFKAGDQLKPESQQEELCFAHGEGNWKVCCGQELSYPTASREEESCVLQVPLTPHDEPQTPVTSSCVAPGSLPELCPLFHASACSIQALILLGERQHG